MCNCTHYLQNISLPNFVTSTKSLAEYLYSLKSLRGRSNYYYMYVLYCWSGDSLREPDKQASRGPGSRGRQHERYERYAQWAHCTAARSTSSKRRRSPQCEFTFSSLAIPANIIFVIHRFENHSFENLSFVSHQQTGSQKLNTALMLTGSEVYLKE